MNKNNRRYSFYFFTGSPYHPSSVTCTTNSADSTCV